MSKLGFTEHDSALLRLLIAGQPKMTLKVKGKRIGSVSEQLERIAATIDQTRTAPGYRNPAAEVLDTFFNGRPAPR